MLPSKKSFKTSLTTAALALTVLAALNAGAEETAPAPITTSTDEKFHQVADKIETIEEKMKRLEARLDKEIEERKKQDEALENRLNALKQQTSEHGTKIKDLAEQLSHLVKDAAKKDELTTAVADLNAKLKKLEEASVKGDKTSFDKAVEAVVTAATVVKGLVLAIAALL